jgi:DnaD/phage-associated family protein
MMEIKTFVRSLSFAQAKILLVMLVERGGLTAEELAFRTGIKDMKTLRAACKELARSEFGLLASQSGAHGRVTWIPSGLLLPLTRSAYFDEPESPPLLTQIGDFPLPDDEQFIIDDIPDRGFSPTWNENQVSDRGKSPICEGSIRLMIDDLNSSSSGGGENLEFPILEKILTAMNVIRGMKFQGKYNESLPWESLSQAEINPKTHPKLALAWVVKAYTDRERLNNPVGMVLTRLKTGAFRSLPENWQERLPGEYLMALGVQHSQTQQSPLMPPAAQTAEQELPQQEPLRHPPEPPAPPEPKPNIFKLYEENIGPLTPMLADILRDAEKSYPDAWVSNAFEIAVKNNHRSWAYVQGVLKKWQENGRDWEPASTRQRSNRGNHQQQTQTRPARSGHGPVGTDSTNTDDDAAALEVLRAQAELAT